MEQGSRDQPAGGVGRPLLRGFWIGTAFAAGAVATFLILAGLAYALDSHWLFDHGLGLSLAILVAGYLAGLVAAIRRPTRRLGVGILIGVTVAFLVVVVVTFVVLAATIDG